MYRYILIPVFLIFTLFGASYSSTGYPDANYGERLDNQEVPNAIIPSGTVEEMIAEVSQERIQTDLKRLTGVEPICLDGECYLIHGRETGSEGLQWAKDYVYATLQNLNYSVEVLPWTSDPYSDENIIARKPGVLHPEMDIYFIAHLDGYPYNGPAADDDASGVVSLLELARILSDESLSYSVVLFFSTGEELGARGARSFVADYPERLESIKYLVSVEMLGWDSNDDGLMEFWSGDQPTDFVEMMSNIITAYPIDLTPEIVTGCT